MSKNKQKGVEALARIPEAQREEIHWEVGFDDDEYLEDGVFLFFQAGSKHFRMTCDGDTAKRMGQALVAAGNGITPKRGLQF